MEIQLPVEDVIRKEVSRQVRTLSDGRTRSILRDEWTQYLATGTMQHWVQQEIHTALESSPIVQAAYKAIAALQETRQELEQVRQRLLQLTPPRKEQPVPAPPAKWRDILTHKWYGRTAVAHSDP